MGLSSRANSGDPQSPHLGAQIPQGYTSAEVLKLHTTQNKDLMAKDCRVLRRSENELRTAWVLEMEEDSLVFLRRRAFRIYLGTQRIRISLLGMDAGSTDKSASQ